MRYQERDDGELLELAAAGWAPAFAVLVHRYGPRVLAAHAGTADPVAHAIATFTRAMRQLPDRDPAAPVGPWLLSLTERPLPAEVPPADPATLDHVWHELQARWPDGRVHHRWPAALSRAAVALAAVGVGVAVPVLLLSSPADDDGVRELRAEPLAEEERPAPPPEELDELEPLPSFEFPDVEPDPTPPPAPQPTPEPTPEPDEPEPDPEPEPEPDEPEPDPEPELELPPEEPDDADDGTSDDGGDEEDDVDDGGDDGGLPIVDRRP